MQISVIKENKSWPNSTSSNDAPTYETICICEFCLILSPAHHDYLEFNYNNNGYALPAATCYSLSTKKKVGTLNCRELN